MMPLKMPRDQSKERPTGGFGSGLIERVDPMRRPRNSLSSVKNLYLRDYPAMTTRPPHVRFADIEGPATGLHPFYETAVASVTRLGDFGGRVQALAMSPNGRYLAVASPTSARVDIYRREGMALVLDEAAGAALDSTGYRVQSMQWSPDSVLLAVACTGGSRNARIFEWTGDGLRLLGQTVINVAASISDVSWTRDGSQLAITDVTNSTVRVFNRNRTIPNSSWTSAYTISLSGCHNVEFSPDGTLIAVSRHNSSAINVYRTDDRSTVTVTGSPSGQRARLSWSGDSMYLAAASRPSSNQSGKLLLWQYNASDDRFDPLELPDIGIDEEAFACRFAHETGFLAALVDQKDDDVNRAVLLRVDGSQVNIASSHPINWTPSSLEWSNDEELLLVPDADAGGTTATFYFDKQRRESLIVGSGKDVYRVTADGQTEKIGTGMAGDRPWHAASLQGKVILTDGEAPVKVYNGLDFVDLPGDPPKGNVILAAYNRVFIAKDNMVYISNVDDPETWTDEDAGSLPVGLHTGDSIQHMASDGPILIWMRSMLYEMRGPDEGQSLNDGWWRINEVTPVGTVNGRTVQRSSLGWIWLSRSGIHYWGGGNNAPLISREIEDTISRINWPYIDTACAWLDRSERYHLSVPLDNATEPSHVIVYDHRWQAFTVYEGFASYSFAANFSSPAFREIGFDVPVTYGIAGGLYTESDGRLFEPTADELKDLQWEMTWGEDAIGSGGHHAILRRIYAVISMRPGATMNMQTSTDGGQTWTRLERMAANSHMTKVRKNLPVSTGEINRGASFMVRFTGTGAVTIHDLVLVGEGLAD